MGLLFFKGPFCGAQPVHLRGRHPDAVCLAMSVPCWCSETAKSETEGAPCASGDLPESKPCWDACGIFQQRL